MAKYEVTYKHLVELEITEIVEATSEEEAIQKSKDGDYLYSDEDTAPQEGVKLHDYKAKLSDDQSEF